MEGPESTGRTARGRAQARRRGFVLLAAGIALSLATMLLARFPGVLEVVYASTVGPPLWRWLSLVTGWLPFSVAALAGSGLVTWTAVRGLRGVARIRSGVRPPGVLLDGAAWLAGLAGTLLLLFYPLWGLNYARAPLDIRLGMAVEQRIDAEELARLTRLAATETNEAYRVLHGGLDDAGAPTSGRVDPVATSRALGSGWDRVASALGMEAVATRRYGPVKTLGVTRLIDFLDIAGVYVPYTGEAHVSGAQPDLGFPAVAAHEQAHQRGLARENEATFAGMLAAIHADDPMARYSGWARVLRALQTDLTRVDRSAWGEIRPTLLPGVVRDWRDYYAYLVDSRSAAAPIVEATNDAYLRAHGVPGGIESYGRVTTLLLEWARRHGGDLRVDGVGAAAS